MYYLYGIKYRGPLPNPITGECEYVTKSLVARYLDEGVARNALQQLVHSKRGSDARKRFSTYELVEQPIEPMLRRRASDYAVAVPIRKGVKYYFTRLLWWLRYG